jgi:hypothetical protein
MPSKDHNLRVAGYGLWGRASCQGDLGIAVSHKVLVDGSHVGIRPLTTLRPRVQGKNQYEAKRGNHLEALSVHYFLLYGLNLAVAMQRERI